MKIGYKDFYIQIEKEELLFIKDYLESKIIDVKNKFKLNVKKEFKIFLNLDETDSVIEVIVIKTTLKNILNKLKEKDLIEAKSNILFKRLSLKDLFNDFKILSFEELSGYENLNIDDADFIIHI